MVERALQREKALIKANYRKEKALIKANYRKEKALIKSYLVTLVLKAFDR